MFLKFLGVGGIATAIQYLLLIFFVELVGMNPVVASTLAYCVSSIFNYSLNYHFTFTSKARHQAAIIKFALVAICGLGINAALMFLLERVMQLHYLPSQIVATLVVLIWNFFAHKFWTYKQG